MKMDTRIAKGVAALSIAALLGLPLSAWATTGSGGSVRVASSRSYVAAARDRARIHRRSAAKALARRAREQTAKKAAERAKKAAERAKDARRASNIAKKRNLTDRIGKALWNRKHAFDNAVAKVSTRIGRVENLSGVVANAGGDVSGVKASLSTARVALDAARAAEAKAVEMFKAVPAAADRKTAFTEARAQARAARVSLVAARTALREAILKLEAIANGLQGVEQ